MSNIPQDLRYTKEHEWAKREDALVVVGVTDHAQAQLGDVVFLELPEVGDTIEADQTFGVIESVKAVSDLFAPLTGKVIEVNAALVDTPEEVNSAPYEAWLIKVEPSDQDAFDALLSADAYAQLLEEEG